jgi:hypothetical protein
MFRGIKKSLTKDNASSEIIPANVCMSLLYSCSGVSGYIEPTTLWLHEALHCKPGLYVNSHLTPVGRMRLS